MHNIASCKSISFKTKLAFLTAYVGTSSLRFEAQQNYVNFCKVCQWRPVSSYFPTGSSSVLLCEKDYYIVAVTFSSSLVFAFNFMQIACH
jgi:hypothetical protein